MHSQYGISSLVLLVLIVLGVFILWETNEYINRYVDSSSRIVPGLSGEKGPGTFCKTGEADNCNDSNDLFILTE